MSTKMRAAPSIIIRRKKSVYSGPEEKISINPEHGAGKIRIYFKKAGKKELKIPRFGKTGGGIDFAF